MSLMRNDSRGFTLVEVLVALVVLAIGLLGLATLQGRALGGGHSAYLRSQATLYAYDIIDRLRVDRVQAMALPSPYQLNDFGDVPANTLPALVKAELDNWLAGVQTLPNGQARLLFTNEGKSRILVQVFVRWDEQVMKLDDDDNPIRPEVMVQTIL